MRYLTVYLLIVVTAPFARAQEEEAISVRTLPVHLVEDQKEIWNLPLKLNKNSHWKPMVALLAATAVLVELDPHDTPYFRRTSTFANFDKTFSSANTGLGEGFFPAAFYLIGLARGDSYAQRSGILSMEALADAEAVSEVIKNISRRRRPIDIPVYGDFSTTWFKAGPGVLVNRGSFLSGHTTGAFAVATVFAERYRRHRWVPLAAYGLSGLVAFSRVSNQNHFPSDVVAGAVIGYSISHFVVLKRHH
jgi:PAP2 superfamily